MAGARLPLPFREGRRGVRSSSPSFQLAACSAIHAVSDGLFAAIYPLLPLMAADLGLSYAESGAIKTMFTGSAGLFQVPAGVLAERAGEHLLLALGTGWVGAGLLGMAVAAGFWPLLAITLLAGLGGNTQHPVATAIVSRVYETAKGGRSRGWAIGTLNFAGDVGKVLAPIATGAATLAFGWRGGLLTLAAIGLAGAALYFLFVPFTPLDAERSDTERSDTERSDSERREEQSPRPHVPASPRPGAAPGGAWGIERPGAFGVLTLIGVLDSAARGASLTFIPFLLQGKGLDAARMSFYFTVLFAAGAAGKFICGPLGDRFGSVAVIALTELVTAAALVALLGTPVAWSLALLVPLGFVLNGTSSVLYAAVAGFVHTSRRARGYGIYYTGVQLASAVAPIVYGVIADRAGLGVTFVAMAAATALIVPLTLATASALRHDAQHAEAAEG